MNSKRAETDLVDPHEDETPVSALAVAALVDVVALTAFLSRELPGTLKPMAGALAAAVAKETPTGTVLSEARILEIVESRVGFLTHGSDEFIGWGQSLAADVSEQVTAAVSKGESVASLTARIERTLGVAGETKGARAATIAVTEVNGLRNDVDWSAYQEDPKVEYARWANPLDSSTRPSHVEATGQVRKLGDPFNVGGVLMRRPHDTGAPASETVNCRCYLLPAEKPSE